MVESFKPEVGFEIQFDVPHNDKIYQHLWKVTDVVPVRKNAYSWKYGGHSGDSVVRASSCSTKGGKDPLAPAIRLTPIGLETFAPATKSRLCSRQFPRGPTALTDLLKDFLASA